MKKNKLMMIMIILLVAITLVGAVAVVVVMKFTGNDSKEPTIDQVIESSVDIPQMTTNLASGDYLRISLKVQTDSKKAKEELQKRDFQVKNIVVEELSEMKSDDLKGKEGKIKFQETLKKRINSLMQDGKVVQVYITEALLQ